MGVWAVAVASLPPAPSTGHHLVLDFEGDQGTSALGTAGHQFSGKFLGPEVPFGGDLQPTGVLKALSDPRVGSIDPPPLRPAPTSGALCWVRLCS